MRMGLSTVCSALFAYRRYAQLKRGLQIVEAYIKWLWNLGKMVISNPGTGTQDSKIA